MKSNTRREIMGIIAIIVGIVFIVVPVVLPWLLGILLIIYWNTGIDKQRNGLIQKLSYKVFIIKSNA